MFLFPPFLLLLLSLVTSETVTNEEVQKTCPVMACIPPGMNGFLGKDGHDGAKGEKRESSTVGSSSCVTLYLPEKTACRYGRNVLSRQIKFFSAMSYNSTQRCISCPLPFQTSTHQLVTSVCLPVQKAFFRAG